LPAYTTSKDTAQTWLDSNVDVMGRQSLTGHGGSDAIFIPRDGQVPDMYDFRLYTQYVPKQAEYRVHVFQGNIIQLQEKKCRRDMAREDRDYRIRNHTRGWVFCQEDVEAPPQVCEYAIKAVELLGLDFGAVDVVYNKLRDKAVVLEINTAPGLGGESTLQAYVNAFSKCLHAA